MKNSIKTAVVATIAALAIGLSGCQTVQGAGKDIQKVGKKAEEVITK